MFDRDKWLEAMSSIDSKYVAEYMDKKQKKAVSSGKNRMNPIIKLVAGIAAGLVLAVLSIYAYKTLTAPRAGEGDAKWWKTHKRFTSISEAKTALGDVFPFSKYSDDDYEVTIDLAFVEGGNAEDRNCWTELDCTLEGKIDDINYTVYFPGFSGKEMNVLKKDACYEVVVNNTKVLYSVYGKDEGFSDKNALVVNYESNGCKYWIEVYTPDEIQAPEVMIRNLLE